MIEVCTDIDNRGKRFTPNFRAQSKVYVPIKDNDDEEDMVFFWKLFSCALENAPVKIGEKGEPMFITRLSEMVNKRLQESKRSGQYA